MFMRKQERVEAIFVGLPVEELTDMLKEDGQAEVICHFCNVGYTLQLGERLEQMIVAKTPAEVHQKGATLTVLEPARTAVHLHGHCRPVHHPAHARPRGGRPKPG